MTQTSSASAATSVSNLANAAIGAGVLSFPFAFRTASIGFGLVCTVAFVMVIGYMLRVLCDFARRYRATSYQQLVLDVLGRRASTAVSIMILIYLVGACAAYLIIIGDNLTPLLENWTDGSPIAKRRIIISFFAIIGCLPLSLMRSMARLGFSSALAVVSIFVLAVSVGEENLRYLADHGVSDSVDWFSVNIDVFRAIPIIVFAFQCHIQVVQVFDELRDDGENDANMSNSLLETNRVPEISDRKSKLMTKVIVIAMSICAVCYTIVGLCGVLRFGSETESNILKNYDSGNTVVNVCRIAVAVTAIVSFPVNHYPARSVIIDFMFNQDSKSRHDLVSTITCPLWAHVGIVVVWMAVTLGLALVVSDLGIVFDLVGATAGVTVIFLVPGALLYNRPARSRRAGAVRQAGMAILALGIIIFVASTTSTIVRAAKGEN